MLLMFILLIHFAAPFIYSGKNVDFSVSLGFPKMGVGGGSGQAVSEPDPPPPPGLQPDAFAGQHDPKRQGSGLCVCVLGLKGLAGGPALVAPGLRGTEGTVREFGLGLNSAHVA